MVAKIKRELFRVSEAERLLAKFVDEPKPVATDEKRLKVAGVVGIDPSLTGTAVCVMHNENQHIVRRFGSKPANGVHDRMERFCGLVENVMSCIEHSVVKVVVIEGYSFASQGSMQLDRIEYGGILRYELDARGYCVVEVPPTQLKKFCCGKGNGDKTGVIASLTKRYDVEFATNDEYDSFGLALIGMCLIGASQPATNAQEGVIEALRKKLVW